MENWLVISDLNIVLNNRENFGGVSNTQDDTLDLVQFIARESLIDLDLRGTKNAWSNYKVGEDLIQFNLDRALISHDWL